MKCVVIWLTVTFHPNLSNDVIWCDKNKPMNVNVKQPKTVCTTWRCDKQHRKVNRTKYTYYMKFWKRKKTTLRTFVCMCEYVKGAQFENIETIINSYGTFISRLSNTLSLRIKFHFNWFNGPVQKRPHSTVVLKIRNNQHT